VSCSKYKEEIRGVWDGRTDSTRDTFYIYDSIVHLETKTVNGKVYDTRTEYEYSIGPNSIFIANGDVWSYVIEFDTMVVHNGEREITAGRGKIKEDFSNKPGY
jgi:hypothetical protein